jgi:hypothetical protein
VQTRAECYASCRAMGSPRGFHRADRIVKVAAVVKRRHEPEARCFAACGADGYYWGGWLVQLHFGCCV